MDFWKAILSLLLRRYVGPPLLLLSVGVAVLAFVLIPTRYSSSTIMVLAVSTNGGTLSTDPARPPSQTNPLLQFDDSLRTSATILIQSMSTREVTAELVAGLAAPATITINDGRSNPGLLGANGPFVYVEGESISATEAQDVVLRTQQRLRDELTDRQRQLGAPPSTFITIIDVVPPSAPEPHSGAKYQLAAAALALTVMFGLAGAYLGQRAFAVRRRRSTRDADREDQDGDQGSDAAHTVNPPINGRNLAAQDSAVRLPASGSVTESG